MTQTLSLHEIKSRIRGPVNSIPTPFTLSGDIDWDGFRRMVELGIDGGSDVTLLTCGNSMLMYLSPAEITELHRVLVEAVAGRTLTVGSTPFCGTRDAVRWAVTCRDLGVDVMMPTPWMTPDLAAHPAGQVAYYRAVAEIMPTMMVGYPALEALAELAAIPAVVSLKEDGSEAYAIKAAAQYADRFAMMSGGQLWRHYTQSPYGVEAFFCCFLSFMPALSRQYWQAVQAQDTAAATALIRRHDLPYFHLDTTYAGRFQAVWRGTLKLHGIAEHGQRSPLHTLTDADLDRLATDLRAIGLLS